ncbi:hypothetical protein QQ020_31720 [Fulvivirgaceae bacterium BMA12]|uniref:Uncharacterized protein n=1 Tax=Agaribacillus aureus TaxID=3051825 RepID=A0ABT8LJU8_9BACT|nr:hypothetical protein [Fulvivirgaceae bacterium BMA12]
MKKVAFWLISLLFIFALSLPGKAGALKKSPAGNKGLFTIQFSWDTDSYPRDYRVGINYAAASKSKVFKGKPQQAMINKNLSATLVLEEGTYRISSIDLHSVSLNGKKISIKFDRTFTIKAGEAVNGGLVFITKEPTSNNVYLLSIDNHQDALWYVKQYHQEYLSSDGKGLSAAWKFIDAQQIDQLVESYEKLIVARAKAKPKNSVKYLYSVLGIMLELEKEKDGTIKGYKSIKTGTHQQIIKSVVLKDKILCLLGQGQYLYGTSQGLSAIPMPEDLESEPRLYLIAVDKFLVFDKNLNIYTSVGEEISWQKQDEFRRSDSQFHGPYLSYGPKEMYIYTTGTGKERRLLHSPYDQIAFKAMPMSDDIKKIPNLIARGKKIIIGPKTTNLVKKGSLIYIKEVDSDEWHLVQAPRGDCNRLYVDKNDDNRFDVTCGTFSKKWKYQSLDGGETWNEVK